MSDDLSPDALRAAITDREVRGYPALLSTDADAVAWARAGGPAGAVVAADYQASPRGRGGLPWSPRPGRDACFSVLLRPAITPDEEGWLFIAAAVGVMDAVAPEAQVAWPDRVEHDGRPVADVAGHAGLGPSGVDWAVVNVLLFDADPPRGPVIGRISAAVEAVQAPDPDVLARYRERCSTLGRDLVAHVIPTWPDGVQIAGTATSVLGDGALVITQADGRRMAVRPQHLARLA